MVSSILLLTTFIGDEVRSEEPTAPKETVFWKRVWPSETPVTTCNDAGGKPYPGTGPGSFTWFNWGGAGAWKVFTLETNEPICIKVSGDNAAINTLKFNLLEDEQDHWIQKFRFDGPSPCSDYRLIYWEPKSKRIRIEADSLYIEVYQRGKQAQQTPETTPLEVRIKDLITLLGHDDWQTREKAQRELEKIGAPTKPFLEEALKNKDPEIVLRARMLWEKLSGETFVWGDLPDEKLNEWTTKLVDHFFSPVITEISQNRKGSAWHEFSAMGELVVRPLLGKLDTPPATQVNIIKVLSELKYKSIIPALGNILLNESPELSIAALEALKLLRTQGFEVAEINSWLQKGYQRLKDNAQRLIQQLLQADFPTRERFTQELIKLGQPAFICLQEKLKEKDLDISAKQQIEKVLALYWGSLFRKAKEIIMRKYPSEVNNWFKEDQLNGVKIVDEPDEILIFPSRFYIFYLASATDKKLNQRVSFGLTADGEIFGLDTTRREISKLEPYLKPADTPNKALKIAILVTRLALLCKQCPDHEITPERCSVNKTQDSGFEVMIKVNDFMAFPGREKDIVIRFNKEGRIASVEGGSTHLH
jgi:hypothetical protein